KLSGKKGKLHAVKADVSKEEDVLKAFRWTEENLGHVHVLINNAGVVKENFLCNGETEKWREVLEVNILGLCVATREAVKIMTANGINGHIIHINSVAGHKVPNFPGLNVYTASKHAVTALAETLRQEFNALGAKIKITSLSPGLVVSEMTTLNTEFSEERQNVMKEQPILNPEDVADAVVYVLSTPEHVQVQELTVAPVGERL
ncbi:dehydrogenase/reductase SDR family member 11-like, partial [Asbolus verrucosus]